MNKKELSLEDIMGMEQRYRAAFINSLGGFKSVALIGTRNAEGQTNLAIFNSLFHLGANPPLFGFVVRPDSVERHTLANILATGQYTVNHIRPDFYRQAHQTSARYAGSTSEFEAVGLTAQYKAGWQAPFVAESEVQIAAELVRRVDIAENGAIILIGKIQFVSIPTQCLQPDGYIDLECAGTVACSGLDSYHTTARLARLTYAKPDTEPSDISMTYGG